MRTELVGSQAFCPTSRCAAPRPPTSRTISEWKPNEGQQRARTKDTALRCSSAAATSAMLRPRERSLHSGSPPPATHHCQQRATQPGALTPQRGRLLQIREQLGDARNHGLERSELDRRVTRCADKYCHGRACRRNPSEQEPSGRSNTAPGTSNRRCTSVWHTSTYCSNDSTSSESVLSVIGANSRCRNCHRFAALRSRACHARVVCAHAMLSLEPDYAKEAGKHRFRRPSFRNVSFRSRRSSLCDTRAHLFTWCGAVQDDDPSCPDDCALGGPLPARCSVARALWGTRDSDASTGSDGLTVVLALSQKQQIYIALGIQGGLWGGYFVSSECFRAHACLTRFPADSSGKTAGQTSVR